MPKGIGFRPAIKPPAKGIGAGKGRAPVKPPLDMLKPPVQNSGGFGLNLGGQFYFTPPTTPTNPNPGSINIDFGINLGFTPNQPKPVAPPAPKAKMPELPPAPPQP